VHCGPHDSKFAPIMPAVMAAALKSVHWTTDQVWWRDARLFSILYVLVWLDRIESTFSVYAED
jgi:hypothetical protein